MPRALPADKWKELPTAERAVEVALAAADRWKELRSIVRMFAASLDAKTVDAVRDVPGWGQLAVACADAFRSMRAAFETAPWAQGVRAADEAVAALRPAVIERRKAATTAKRKAAEAQALAEWEKEIVGVYDGRGLELARVAAKASARVAGARAVHTPARRMRELREAAKVAAWERDAFEEKVLKLLGPHPLKAVTESEIQVAEEAAWEWLLAVRARMAKAKGRK